MLDEDEKNWGWRNTLVAKPMQELEEKNVIDTSRGLTANELPCADVQEASERVEEYFLEKIRQDCG